MSEHVASDDPGVIHPHILPLSLYFRVWGALLVLTGVTVAVSYFDFGEGNMAIAVIVAMIKASLVAAFFMHLKYDNKLNAVVFCASLVFMFIFFFLTFADVSTRGWVDKYQGTFLNAHKEKTEAKEERPDAKNVAPAAPVAAPQGATAVQKPVEAKAKPADGKPTPAPPKHK